MNKIEWIYTCDLGRDVGNEYNGADMQKEKDKS